MAKLYKSLAIVLDRKIAKDKDIVANLFLESGNLGMIRGFGLAKAVRRSPIVFEPGNTISVIYSEYKKLWLTYKEGHVVRPMFLGCVSYLDIAIVTFFLQISRMILRYNKEQSVLYQLLDGSLREYTNLKRNEAPQEQKIFLIVFFLCRMMRNQGYMGDLHNCSICNQDISQRSYWQLSQISFLCENCATQANQQYFYYQQILLYTEHRYGHYKEKIQYLQSQLGLNLDKSEIKTNRQNLALQMLQHLSECVCTIFSDAQESCQQMLKVIQVQNKKLSLSTSISNARVSL